MNPADLRASFVRLTQAKPECVSYAPGRVNLIGEHTDYNEGFVLPAAIDRGVALVARRVPGKNITLHAADLKKTCVFSLDNIEKDSAHPWADYFKGVAWALFIRGLSLSACEVVVTGDLPLGAGLSSSAAYEVATTLLFKNLVGFEMSTLEIAQVSQEAENGFVGVACGIMDQVASAFGEEGRALLLDCRTLARETVELPPGLKIVVVNSGVKHSLASSEYNRRRKECEEGVACLSALHPGLSSLRDAEWDDLSRAKKNMPPKVFQRCRHVISENARVLETVKALRASDRRALKRLMLESHNSLRDDYEVSCPELDILVELASDFSSCHGTRMTGGGFGGCTVNLVEEGAVESFARTVQSGYRDRTGKSATVYEFKPSAGAKILSPETGV